MNRVWWLLFPLLKERPTRIAELLSPLVGSSESWNRRLVGLFLQSDCGASRDFFNFTIKLVDAGALDEILDPGSQDDNVWSPLESVARTNPAWACEVVVSYLRRSYALAKKSGTSTPFSSMYGAQRTGEEVIANTAKAAPQKFVETLLPFLITVVEANADRKFRPPWRDHIWGHGAIGLQGGLANTLLSAMESALAWMAAHDLNLFRAHAEELRKSEYHTIQNLLLRSYAAAGEAFADEAIAYLLECPERRFCIDYISSSSDHAITLLLSVVAKFCSTSNLSELERHILIYYPEREQGLANRDIRGMSQLLFLESIDVSRTSKNAKRRLQELRRKFGDNRPPAPSVVQGGFVGPPIPEASARKMNDDAWLGAIEHYSSNSPSKEPAKLLVGGAHQQSQVLEKLTREDPKRFAKFVHRIPDDANPAYFEAILRGITDVDVEIETVVSACPPLS